MPPIAIAFHASSSTSPSSARITPRLSITLSRPHDAQVPTQAPAQANATSSTMHVSARRKPVTVPTSTATASVMTPLLLSILVRCLPSASHSTPTSPPTTASSSSHPLITSKKRSHASPPTAKAQHKVHPYDPLSDRANTRSLEPSPREIERARRAEEDKVRARREGAEKARAAAAARRKRGRKAGGGGGTSSRGRSDSPGKAPLPPHPAPALNGEGEVEGTEPKGDIPAPRPRGSTEVPGGVSQSQAPPTGRFGLKRTRSQGLSAISAAQANSLAGPNTSSIGSPLRLVTGASNSPSSDADADDGGRDPKRSRLTQESSMLLLTDEPESLIDGGKRRATTHSPRGTPATLEPERGEGTPKTLPMPSARPLPRLNVQVGGGGGGGVGMRRAVSAQGGEEAKARGVRTGSVGPVVERSRRETTLPGRFRDYEVRAGGA